jgi:hypothetical protein
MIPTSATIASSIALRLRHLAPRIHALGVAPLHHLLCELAGGADPIDRAERYAALPADFIAAYGGDELPPVVRLVK